MAIRAAVRTGAFRAVIRRPVRVPQGPGPLGCDVMPRLGPRRSFGASGLDSRAGLFRGAAVGLKSNSRTPLMQ